MIGNQLLYGTNPINGEPLRPRGQGPLRDRFIIPPFSMWDTRERFWQDRRRKWLGLGIRSEEGRDGKLTFQIPERLADGRVGNRIKNQTSVFDPVLCELAYQFWGGVPESDTDNPTVVLDPFAGGSVRGIVAAALGLKYRGIELRAEQVIANRAQVNDGNIGQHEPKWKCGDSFKMLPPRKLKADFLFSCPPYGNLEKYSDDPADLSNMPYDEFLERYREIIAKGVATLRNNRFACFVVSNFRDKQSGEMYNLMGDTTTCFEAAGMKLYNDIVLVNSVGTGAMRANNTFVRGARKMVRMHQYVMVYIKGSPQEAAKRIPADDGTRKGGRKHIPKLTSIKIEEGVDDNQPEDGIDNTPEFTPVEKHGDIYIKRDDLFTIAGACGGKARGCWHHAQGAIGLITACSRTSPQMQIVARIANHLGIPCHCHIPWSKSYTPEMTDAENWWAELKPCKPGHGTVYRCRARQDAEAHPDWTLIPYGMTHPDTVQLNREQVANIPTDIKRIVITLGSGTSAAGLLLGLEDQGLDIPVLGVRVGSDPTDLLKKYAPPSWPKQMTIVTSKYKYGKAVKASIGDIPLDPHYEAKCYEYLRPGDLFWIVGHRAV